MFFSSRKTADPTPVVPAGSRPGSAAHSGSAIDLTKITATAPALVDLYKKAGVSLKKHGLAGVRAAVYLVLDHSGSMFDYYADGTVQALAERVLAAAAHFDDDGTVPVVLFESRAHRPEPIVLGSHQGRIAELAADCPWGGTDYACAIDAVVKHYKASGATDPAFVIFQTDGAPASRPDAESALRHASTLPIFWQFVGFGSEGQFDFLRRLDTLRNRAVDNAGFFAAGPDPRAMSDTELYDKLMTEFPQWLIDARAAGVL
ncbi:toxic cation resistance protein [Embleya scabrispora]|uniref:Toxic cation resistance protein n=1 Tax=Embleya scabrispora TaxID=159449 RepID=A0A1T3P5B0_9ACTN|nr:VWA domain-containing protein [Embleya scabrispora]OPC84182.1 toxic cation resistance protein [Embleya scabrispora]